MFKNQSIRFLVVASTLIGVVLTGAIGGLGLLSTLHTDASLDHFYSDFFRSISKLQAIEDIYEGVIRPSVQRVMTKTVEGSEIIDVIDEAITEGDVRLKAYLDSERAKEGGRHLMNQEFENAMDNVNVSWLSLKSLIQAGSMEQFQQAVIDDFYPKMDSLNRHYSQLMQRWMDQLETDRGVAQEKAALTRELLLFVIPLALASLIFFALLILRRLTTAVDSLASQIEVINAEKADFTRRVVLKGNDETNRVSLKFNHFMDHLLATIRRVKISGLAVATSMPEITSSAKDLSHRISDFGNFTTEVGATAKEISATSQELVKLMTDVSQTATNTAELATSGQNELVRLETTMKQMEEASRQISKRLAIISEKAANITMVVTTINKFADQTNLLSLNASIEAEKAGEYGLGFAVVAREIRRLADQVALATLDIEQMVKEMKSAVSSGVMEMDKFTDEVRNDVRDVRNIGTQLAQIIEHVQTLIPSFESVHGAVQAQAEGAKQISDSMSQLSEAVEDATNALKTSTGTVTHIVEAAKDLQKEISTFVVDAS